MNALNQNGARTTALHKTAERVRDLALHIVLRQQVEADAVQHHGARAAAAQKHLARRKFGFAQVVRSRAFTSRCPMAWAAGVFEASLHN